VLNPDIFICESDLIKTAFDKLNRTAQKVLLVVDETRRLLGTLSDGDLRRYALTKGADLASSIRDCYNKQSFHLKWRFSLKTARDIFLKHKIELIPILDEEDRVVDCLTWAQLFSREGMSEARVKDLEMAAVIMAGGRGVRLAPFTKILPKPLIPIGDRPIIEVIVNGFREQGISKYYITLNHKAEMIESYFNGIEKDYEVRFTKEDDFLGTAGSLKLLEEEISDCFIVSNCDVITKVDFEDVANFHRERNSLLTILSPLQHYKIPYGIIDFKKGGEVKAILEKPEYTFTINAGVYILNREALGFIPAHSFFDMTDLIKVLIENNRKVVTYPIDAHSYIDIGQWDEYRKTVDCFNKVGAI
jgi:dTDP-glucose pyrophosphorylase